MKDRKFNAMIRSIFDAGHTSQSLNSRQEVPCIISLYSLSPGTEPYWETSGRQEPVTL